MSDMALPDMQILHQSALQADATLIAPLRRARLQRMANRGEAPISVPFYHRVADSHPNPWTIGKNDFKRHLEYCRENYEMIDLAEVQRRVRQNDSYSPSVSFTFDDGYGENCEFALPLMLEMRIPCTYFVTTSNVRDGHSFEHDLKAERPLAVNNIKQIREFSDAGIEIGCHTQNHIDFSKAFDRETIRAEIFDAKSELEQWIGKPVRYFAFPYGMPHQLTQMAIETILAAGFDGFCSAFGAYNLVGRDAFHIRRFHGDPEFARFVNWLSYKPCKVRREPTVRYFLPTLRSFERTVQALNTPTPERRACF